LHDREAKRVEAEARQADQAHWLATGKDGTREGYRAYLERYPEGIHAEKALAGLDRLAAASDRAEERAERVAFREAEAAGTREAYRRFLTRYPAGNYQAQAERELARLDAREAALGHRAAEERLGLDLSSRRSLEQRLEYLGFDPGPADGTFDRDTRRALRLYQADRGLTRTGFFDRDTVALVVQETNLQGTGNVVQQLIRSLQNP
ncbi:MAG: peptidoglycan-binding domain-containing protein, partial [Pseudomonadota bacterium]